MKARAGTRQRPVGAADAGSATIWVLACAALVLFVGLVGVIRADAVGARHRAEAAADAAALAAAGQIGIGPLPCAAAREIAAANGAVVEDCRLRLAPDGRSGQVAITVAVSVHLPFAGPATVRVSARAAREPADVAFVPL